MHITMQILYLFGQAVGHCVQSQPIVKI